MAFSRLWQLTTTTNNHKINPHLTYGCNALLASRDLQPETHLVDMGYLETDLLVSSQQHGIDLVGPVPSSKSWQDQEEDAFDHTQFDIDWERSIATCPAGKTSERCMDRKTWRGTPNVAFRFARDDCQSCALRARCSRAKNAGRTLAICPQEEYEVLLAARERQEMDEFKELYGERAGIEGTISQGVRSMQLRRTRYVGLARTHLQHVATAAAINILRIVDWLNGERPKETPVSPFMELVA